MTSAHSIEAARRQTAPPEWYEGDAGRDEIADLIRWLDDTCQLRGISDVIHIVEKPWHYSAEREQMIRARGRVA